jgi:tetratricopeptide (TPR) repeat protein
MPEQEHAASDENNGENHVSRSQHSLSGEGDRDTIVAEVGDGAQNVAIGKNVRQFVAENLQVVIEGAPAHMPLVGISALMSFLVLAILLWMVFRPTNFNDQADGSGNIDSSPACLEVNRLDPRKMTGDFNVAIAQFGQVDSEGNVHPSEDGQRLSQWLYDRLLDEFKSDCPAELAIQIWHDSMDSGYKEIELRTMLGDTIEARAKAAAALADEISADMVVYGNLVSQGDLTSFTPEFYVSELSEGEEIVGRHQLGTPIPVQLPVDGLKTRLRLNKTLISRIKALGLFTIGLAFDANREPGKALELLREIEKLPGWADDEGKEILYAFIGREAQRVDRPEEAQSAYEQALNLNPNYARARLGLGHIYYGQAQDLLYEDTLDYPFLDKVEIHLERRKLFQALDQAIVEYKRALDAALDSSDIQSELKAHLSLGGVYRLKGDAYRYLGDYDSADSFFDAAIPEFHKSLELTSAEQHQLVGQVYLGLGTTYHLKSEQQEAVNQREALLIAALEAYDQCIKQAELAPSDYWLGYFSSDFCVPYRDLAQEKLLSLGEGGTQ